MGGEAIYQFGIWNKLTFFIYSMLLGIPTLQYIHVDTVTPIDEMKSSFRKSQYREDMSPYVISRRVCVPVRFITDVRGPYLELG